MVPETFEEEVGGYLWCCALGGEVHGVGGVEGEALECGAEVVFKTLIRQRRRNREERLYAPFGMDRPLTSINDKIV